MAGALALGGVACDGSTEGGGQTPRRQVEAPVYGGPPMPPPNKLQPMQPTQPAPPTPPSDPAAGGGGSPEGTEAE